MNLHLNLMSQELLFLLLYSCSEQTHGPIIGAGRPAGSGSPPAAFVTSLVCTQAVAIATGPLRAPSVYHAPEIPTTVRSDSRLMLASLAPQ